MSIGESFKIVLLIYNPTKGSYSKRWVISEFGEEFFFDFPIEEGVFKDIYEEELLENDHHVYYTSTIGEIKSSYSISLSEENLSIKLCVSSLIKGFDL